MQIEVKQAGRNFEALHEAMQAYVDAQRLPFISTVIVKGQEAIDVKHCVADQGNGTTLTLGDDTLFRANSVSKIVTSIAAMMLREQGLLALDDPLQKYLPEFTDLQVLDSTSEKGQVPARSSITLRHLLSHTSGLSYGFIEPESVIDQRYNQAGVNPMLLPADSTLDDLCKLLAQLPLAFHPGEGWRYSFATDVMARVIEVVSGQRFDHFLQENILNALGMVDTGFYVPKQKQSRFLPAYSLADPTTYSAPVGDVIDSPVAGMFSQPTQLLSGGGGLVSTLHDCYQLLRLIMSGGQYDGGSLLSKESLQLMQQDQCPADVFVQSPSWHMPSTKFGLGFAIKQKPEQGEPASAAGEFHWGGIFGLHLWVSPIANIGGLCMTQVFPGFLHPFSRQFKQLAYQLAADDSAE
ncbi:serine hydrolase domain-containing protein [Maricurvus nonylphenolicus]|uniref:serine hydrolase domain-containing protein n=1 Tax=Maricurvus nonylphenolicus TaxID=1008307 RepID=UPI0036F2BAA1